MRNAPSSEMLTRPFKRTVGRLTLLSFILISATAAGAPLSFERAIQLAMSEAPEVTAKALQVEAARSAAIPAGALADPKLFLGLDNYPLTGPNGLSFRDQMTMATAGIMQELPNGAKRRARTDRAQAEITVARAELLSRQREIAQSAAVAWLDAYYAQRRTAILDTLEAENRLLRQTLASRLASGLSTPAEAVAPDIEDALLEDRRTELRAQRLKARAELRRWLGPDADGPLAEEAPALAVEPAVLRMNLERHPALRVYEAALARASAETREAEASRRPDLALQGAVHHRAPEFGWMISAQVTFDLPLFTATRQEPLIAAKLAEANRIRVERDGVHRRLLAELESRLAEYAAAKEELERIRGTTLPLMRRKVELAMASYGAGRTSLDAVLAARRERVETELTALQREAEMAKAAARLSVFFGSTIP